MFMPRKILEEKLKQLLTEDVGQGDVTSAAVVPASLLVKASILAKEAGVVAGIEETKVFAETLGLNVQTKTEDGAKIRNGQVIMTISGDAQTILSAERTMLNLLSRMCGIATVTRRLVEKIEKANLPVKIAATRKIAPGLSYFDKKAVFIGGGDTHRLHLDDMILLKDNHIAIAGDVEHAVKKTKQIASFSKKIEVEVTSVKDALKAAEAGADIIMLDNFSPNQIQEAVEALKKAGFTGVLLEASGRITEENILDYAQTGVNIISIGELTHSFSTLDISLEIAPIKRKSQA